MDEYTIYKTLADREGRSCEFLDYSWEEREERIAELKHHNWIITGTTEED